MTPYSPGCDIAQSSVIAPSLFHLYVFLSPLQSLSTLVPSAVRSSHSSRTIFSKHKTCQWITIYYRKKIKLSSMVTWSSPLLPLGSHLVPGPPTCCLHHPTRAGFCPSAHHDSFHRKDFAHEFLLPVVSFPLLVTELILTYAPWLNLFIISLRKSSLNPLTRSKSRSQRIMFCSLLEKTMVAVFPFVFASSLDSKLQGDKDYIFFPFTISSLAPSTVLRT